MKSRKFAPRVIGIILSLSLALPSPAWGLRVQGIDAESTREDVAAGLEGKRVQGLDPAHDDPRIIQQVAEYVQSLYGIPPDLVDQIIIPFLQGPEEADYFANEAQALFDAVKEKAPTSTASPIVSPHEARKLLIHAWILAKYEPLPFKTDAVLHYLSHPGNPEAVRRFRSEINDGSAAEAILQEIEELLGIQLLWVLSPDSKNIDRIRDVSERWHPASYTVGFSLGFRRLSPDQYIELLDKEMAKSKPDAVIIADTRKGIHEGWITPAGLRSVRNLLRDQEIPVGYLPNMRTLEEYAIENLLEALNRNVLQSAAGLEGVRQRMPQWLRAHVTAEELVGSIYRVHDIPRLYEGIAVLMERPLLARENADPEIVASRLVRLKKDLRSVATWSDAIPVRVSVWSQKLEDAYRAHGFRVVRITRDETDSMRDPIPTELLLLAVVRAVASGEELFAVNVTADYLRLRGVTYQEIHDTLADLFA